MVSAFDVSATADDANSTTPAGRPNSPMTCAANGRADASEQESTCAFQRMARAQQRHARVVPEEADSAQIDHDAARTSGSKFTGGRASRMTPRRRGLEDHVADAHDRVTSTRHEFDIMLRARAADYLKML